MAHDGRNAVRHPSPGLRTPCMRLVALQVRVPRHSRQKGSRNHVWGAQAEGVMRPPSSRMADEIEKAHDASFMPLAHALTNRSSRTRSMAAAKCLRHAGARPSPCCGVAWLGRWTADADWSPIPVIIAAQAGHTPRGGNVSRDQRGVV